MQMDINIKYDGTKVLANKNSANTTCILKKKDCRLWDLPESVLILFKMVKSYSRWSNEMRMPPVKN